MGYGILILYQLQEKMKIFLVIFTAGLPAAGGSPLLQSAMPATSLPRFCGLH